jgi:hypothetical protein
MMMDELLPRNLSVFEQAVLGVPLDDVAQEHTLSLSRINNILLDVYHALKKHHNESPVFCGPMQGASLRTLHKYISRPEQREYWVSRLKTFREDKQLNPP